MTELQMETLEKLFPNGFVCVGIMPNCTVHISYSNTKHSGVLSEIESVISDSLEEMRDIQESENESDSKDRGSCR